MIKMFASDLDGTLLNALHAVSYTHLDVYKRQLVERIAHGKRGGGVLAHRRILTFLSM